MKNILFGLLVLASVLGTSCKKEVEAPELPEVKIKKDFNMNINPLLQPVLNPEVLKK